MLADATICELGRATMLRRWWAVAGLALFGVTWKLWTPQTEFPQVPLLRWAESLPLFVDWLAFGVLLGSLAFAAWNPDSRRCWLVVIVSLSVLIFLDQHRLQPWAWQLLLMAILWSSAGVGQVSNLPAKSNSGQVGNLPHVVLTISIYFWSAISKLDADFVSSHGQTLIEALLRSVGINAANWTANWKSCLAVLLPVGELSLAVGLCWSRTRRAALIAATALHVGLILALGPLGLGHRPGVLLWNVAFIGHDWLLFGARSFAVPHSVGASQRTAFRLNAGLRTAVIAFVCIWPMTKCWRLCDRWLAWSVYSAQSERVSVTFTDEGLCRLPESARRCVTDGELPLDRWSLAALDAPIYPQLRFHFGVVEWLRRRCGEDHLVEVIVQHSQGAGGEIERMTIGQLDEHRLAFWINTRPRGLSPL